MELNLSPLEAMIVAINKKEVRERPSNEIKKDLNVDYLISLDLI